ncbi:MAG: GGDEF domain-containing protein [bacterium]|nr:GGDEF domain-containing protein [bacterium]
MNETSNKDFIWEISQTLSCNTLSAEIANGLKRVFNKFYGIDEINVIYFDERQNSFHDFADTSRIFEDKTEKKYKAVFEKLGFTLRPNFILNDKTYIIDDDFHVDNEVNLKKDENIFYFPLVQNYKCIGFIELYKKGSKSVDNASVKSFFIAAAAISAMVLNKILTNKITKIADFYKAQKNIAKILETQYEYSFLIPVIGEILDNFAKDYFAYIFMKNDAGKFEIAWPLRYDKKRIQPMIEHISTKNKVMVKDDYTAVLFPIYFENALQGAIIIDGKSRKILQEDIDFLLQLSVQTATTLDKAGVYAEIEKYATQDALTGLNNRRSLDLRIAQEVAVAKRKSLPLCVMMLDIDFFKKINDTYGHYVGDIVLKSFASIIKDEVREYDFPSRYGGEEFFIILPSTTMQEATSVANRLRERIQNTPFDISKFSNDVKELNITTSVGLAELLPEMDVKKLYVKVDKALYEAKKTGRNKVVVL